MEKNIFNSFFAKIFVSKASNKNFGEKTIKYIIIINNIFNYIIYYYIVFNLIYWLSIDACNALHALLNT